MSSPPTTACESPVPEPLAEARPRATPYQSSAEFWLNFLFFCACRAPWFVRLSKPFWMFLSQHFFQGPLRGGIDRNARWLLGPKADAAARRALADRVLENFYLFVYDVGRAGLMNRAQILAQIGRTAGEEHFHRALARGRGVILATVHLGSFEVGVAAASSQGPPVHVVFQEDVMDAFNRIRHRLHRTLGVVEAPVEDGWQAWMKLRDALARKELVLMQADRVMPGHRGVAVPFCGGHIELPLGPVKLAALSGAPIVPVFAPRQADGTVDLIIEPAIDVGGDEVGPGSCAVPPALLALARTIQKQVLAHPDQWLMLHSVWLEDRAGPPVNPDA